MDEDESDSDFDDGSDDRCQWCRGKIDWCLGIGHCPECDLYIYPDKNQNSYPLDRGLNSNDSKRHYF
jgi:hypothetical protein